VRLDRLNMQSINSQSSAIVNFLEGSSPVFRGEVFEVSFFDIEEVVGRTGLFFFRGPLRSQDRHRTKLIRSTSKVSRIIQD